MKTKVSVALCLWLVPAVLSVHAAYPGAVVAWGDNGSGETTVPLLAQSGVVAIAAGLQYTVALKTDGSVVAWGLNGYNQTTVPLLEIGRAHV